MATIGTYWKNKGEFDLRASHKTHTESLRPECQQKMDAIVAAIAAEQRIPCEKFAELTDDVILGADAAPLCQDWIYWLMENDPDGDWEYL